MYKKYFSDLCKMFSADRKAVNVSMTFTAAVLLFIRRRISRRPFSEEKAFI